MPLLPCPRCGAPVSETASSCALCLARLPGAGASPNRPAPARRRASAATPVLAGGALLLAYVVVLGVAGVMAETRPVVGPDSLALALSPPHILPAARGEEAAAPGWEVEEGRGRGDTVRTVLLTRAAEADVDGWGTVARPLLLVRCMEGETRVIVDAGVPLEPGPGGDEVPVEVRLDGGAAETARWTGVDGTHALMAREPGAAHARRLAGARRLHVTFSAFNAGARTAEFDLAGLSDVLPKVAAACGWRYP
jgi:hypothetical protein